MNKTSTTEQQVTIEYEYEPDTPNTPNPFYNSRNRCCFTFPCFGPGPGPHLILGGAGPSSSPSSSLWDRIRVGESEDKWWASPIKALKKIREWSEIVAGPKWKTFIRRFNRNSRHRHGHGHGHVSPGKFQYDPLSYALNFDEGQGQNGHLDEAGFVENYPDFSSRFAVLPPSAKTSMDLGKVTPLR